jgi:hypothetical protein
MPLTKDQRLDAALCRLRADTESLAQVAYPWERLLGRLAPARPPGLVEAFLLSARRLLLIGAACAAIGAWTHHRTQARRADLILRLDLEGPWLP